VNDLGQGAVEPLDLPKLLWVANCLGLLSLVEFSLAITYQAAAAVLFTNVHRV